MRIADHYSKGSTQSRYDHIFSHYRLCFVQELNILSLLGYMQVFGYCLGGMLQAVHVTSPVTALG
jgi:hypothetical protein